MPDSGPPPAPSPTTTPAYHCSTHGYDYDESCCGEDFRQTFLSSRPVRDLLVTDSFASFYLSVRTASGLRNRFHVLGRGEPTIGAIVDTPDEELLRVPTIGPVAVAEVHRLRAAVEGASDAPAPPRCTLCGVLISAHPVQLIGSRCKGYPPASPAQEATPPRCSTCGYPLVTALDGDQYCQVAKCGAAGKVVGRAAPTPEATTPDAEAIARIGQPGDANNPPVAALPCDCFDPECGYPHGANRIGRAPEATGAPDREEELTRYDRLRLLAALRFDGDALHYFDRQDAALLDRLLREHHDLRATVAALTADREAAQRVHLRRHTRLAEALGMDPGYSVDATIDAAITVIVASRALTAERGARAQNNAGGTTANGRQQEPVPKEEGPARVGRMLSAPEDFNPHPDYGPCGGFHHGQCAVCRDLLYTLIRPRDTRPDGDMGSSR